MDNKSFLSHLLTTLSVEEKIFVALRFNQELRSPLYMTYDPSLQEILVFCTKNKRYLPILDELGEGCTNCKLASNIQKITAYVNQYRSAVKTVSTVHST